MSDLEAAAAGARVRLEVARERRPAQSFAELLEVVESARSSLDEPRPDVKAI